MSYDKYLEKFYPQQEETIFTTNNWTISNELVEIFNSNFFYVKHIRWNVQRYGPVNADTMTQVDVDNAPEVLFTQPPMPNTTDTRDDIRKTMSQQIKETETTSATTRPKRKAALHDNYENQLYSRARRCKKLS